MHALISIFGVTFIASFPILLSATKSGASSKDAWKRLASIQDSISNAYAPAEDLEKPEPLARLPRLESVLDRTALEKKSGHS